jgi:hypothetical protein
VEKHFFDGPLRNAERIKVDWHDYLFIEYEAKRVGLGEQGKDAFVTYEDTELQRHFNTQQMVIMHISVI